MCARSKQGGVRLTVEQRPVVGGPRRFRFADGDGACSASLQPVAYDTRAVSCELAGRPCMFDQLID